MTWDKIKWLKVTQSDLEWPREPMEIVWMTQYDFRWVKSTTASPFWGPLDLDILIYSDSVTSQRETTILCGLYLLGEEIFLQIRIFLMTVFSDDGRSFFSNIKDMIISGWSTCINFLKCISHSYVVYL